MLYPFLGVSRPTARRTCPSAVTGDIMTTERSLWLPLAEPSHGLGGINLYARGWGEDVRHTSPHQERAAADGSRKMSE